MTFHRSLIQYNTIFYTILYPLAFQLFLKLYFTHFSLCCRARVPPPAFFTFFLDVVLGLLFIKKVFYICSINHSTNSTLSGASLYQGHTKHLLERAKFNEKIRKKKTQNPRAFATPKLSHKPFRVICRKRGFSIIDPVTSRSSSYTFRYGCRDDDLTGTLCQGISLLSLGQKWDNGSTFEWRYFTTSFVVLCRVI